MPRKGKYDFCVDCTIPKFGRQRCNPRCRSCGVNKSNRDRGLSPAEMYKTCSFCGKEKPNSPRKRCRKCSNIGKARSDEAREKIRQGALDRWLRYREDGFGLTQEGRENQKQGQYRRWQKHKNEKWIQLYNERMKDYAQKDQESQTEETIQGSSERPC